MMEHLIIAGIAGLSFVAGWITKSLSVDKIVEQTKHDIQHVQALKSKEYKRGYESGMTARYEMDEV